MLPMPTVAERALHSLKVVNLSRVVRVIVLTTEDLDAVQ